MWRKTIYLCLFIVFAFLTPSLAKTSKFTYGQPENPSAFQPPSPNFGGYAGASSSGFQASASSSDSTNEPSLRIFTSTYKNAVDASPLLPNVFNLGQVDVQVFADFLFNAMYTQLYRGFYDPQDLASYASKPITEKSTVLTYPTLVNIYANSIGNQLLAKGILNEGNAASLAYAFATEMEISAQKLVGLESQESKFQALVDGFIGFLKSKDLYTPYNLHSIGRYLAKEINAADPRSDFRKESKGNKKKHN